MTIVSKDGRYACHTCQTVFKAKIVPILTDRNHGIPTVRRVEAFINFIKEYCVPYWQGSQGITTKNFIEGLVEYLIWHSVRHKCHHVSIIHHDEQAPVGYRPDPPITDAESKVYRTEYIKRYGAESVI